MFLALVALWFEFWCLEVLKWVWSPATEDAEDFSRSSRAGAVAGESANEDKPLDSIVLPFIIYSSFSHMCPRETEGF